MRRTGFSVMASGAALVAVFSVGIIRGSFPLGFPGEWEWQRISARPSVFSTILALSVLVGYAAFVALGMRSLIARKGTRREIGWILGLAMASVGVQAMVQEGAPEGYGLSKWIFALHAPGSSGYFTVAKSEMEAPKRFLADYPEWIARQDALHVGTHPPGLFLTSRAILGVMESNPGLARVVSAASPPSVSMAIQALRGTKGMSRADGASLTLTGALTLLACASTVLPLYGLARSSMSAPASWAAASFWPLVPSAILFQPTADTAFPLLSTTALAMAAWAGRMDGPRQFGLALISGIVMAVGMEFTLAFLPIGLVVAMLYLTSGKSGRDRIGLLGATGVGFLGATLLGWAASSANPFVIWWWNQRNHARFYDEYPRTYYLWILANPIELAVGLGLPITIWVLVGLFGSWRSIRVSWAALIVLVILTISGRNLSEVARLWLPLMPGLLIAAGSGFDRFGASPRLLAASVISVGVQTLLLQAAIQVVYPI
ncbi:hypothetical protein P12x_004231 [Tundrisphaera lichenicola]|uniref:hypothetical protein n=1 Tax=Tundrisphaera lichenicola TaxID=2029860 RepID=UPI003EC04583